MIGDQIKVCWQYIASAIAIAAIVCIGWATMARLSGGEQSASNRQQKGYAATGRFLPVLPELISAATLQKDAVWTFEDVPWILRRSQMSTAELSAYLEASDSSYQDAEITRDQSQATLVGAFNRLGLLGFEPNRQLKYRMADSRNRIQFAMMKEDGVSRIQDAFYATAGTGDNWDVWHLTLPNDSNTTPCNVSNHLLPFPGKVLQRAACWGSDTRPLLEVVTSSLILGELELHWQNVGWRVRRDVQANDGSTVVEHDGVSVWLWPADFGTHGTTLVLSAIDPQ